MRSLSVIGALLSGAVCLPAYACAGPWSSVKAVNRTQGFYLVDVRLAE